MIFQLLLVNPQTAVTQTLPLPRGETILLGSGDLSNIRLQHPFVAENHAQLVITEDGVALTDLESVNGTAVNGHRIPPSQPIALNSGDVIDIGLFQLTLQIVNEADDLDDGETAVPPPSQPPIEPPHREGASLPPPNKGRIEKDEADSQIFSRYVQYLPAFYDVPFMHRFLKLFESLLEPIVYRIDSRDLLLDGQTTPAQFLPWLANWYAFTFDYTWTESQKRKLLYAAPAIFGSWGTAKALKTVLDIYVGQPVTIVDDDRLPPFTFRVEVPLPPDDEQQAAMCRLINAHKPAHTSFELVFTGQY